MSENLIYSNLYSIICCSVDFAKQYFVREKYMYIKKKKKKVEFLLIEESIGILMLSLFSNFFPWFSGI